MTKRNAPASQSIPSALLSWYGKVKRDLPWRRTRDPYAIWVSEVMLQQTRVETVIPYYERFLHAFPTLAALAEADESAVLVHWSGLGYYRRARLLHHGARAAASGGLPRTAEELENVPGIGRYTAAAIASIAHGQAAPLVDGNVSRVLARLFAIKAAVDRGPGKKRVWALATDLVSSHAARRDPGAFNQALMELGATVCTPRHPKCATCPVSAACEAQIQGLQSTLPVVTQKTPPRAWPRVALVAVAGDRVLLARRARSALMSGLWEPPMIDRGDESPVVLAERVADALGMVVTHARETRQVVHVLTHRRMSVTVVRADADEVRPARASPQLDTYDAFAMANPRERQKLPTSTLTNKLIAASVPLGPQESS